uniref:Uncharacterized protein n=1 Tax=Rhizophora mucronata TaxID=61149 RepID=A0A2P2QMN3_RHIMU
MRITRALSLVMVDCIKQVLVPILSSLCLIFLFCSELEHVAKMYSDDIHLFQNAALICKVNGSAKITDWTTIKIVFIRYFVLKHPL